LCDAEAVRGRRRLLAGAAAELERYGLDRDAARAEARRAFEFRGEFERRRAQLNSGDVAEAVAFVDSFGSSGAPPPASGGTLLLTLHYGLYPLLTVWLHRAAHGGSLPPYSLLYASELYQPDIPPEQYARFAALDAVAPDRGAIDLTALGPRAALDAASERLAAGGTVLVFPDAYGVRPERRNALVCRVGNVTVGYPAGAARLARTPGVRLQGVVLRPTASGHELAWGTPRRTPAPPDEVAAVLQELFELSVARDPVPWQAWFSA
jgi:hypothetical protein